MLAKDFFSSTGDSRAQDINPIVIAKPTPKYSKKETVCLDPGHGGEDPGAVNKNISERDINLTVASKVQLLLETQGYQVFMTRTTNDDTLSNNDRYTFCNSKNTTIMVSIHHNFFEDKTVDYATTLYYKDIDQSLAQDILNATSVQLNVTNNGISQFEDGVLSKTTMPAALSEAFFVTNSSEYTKLTSSSARLTDEAQGIYTGIVNYFTDPTPPQIEQSVNPQLVQSGY